MSNSSDRFSIRDDELVERLLEHAPPRPAPPEKDEAMVRDAVFAEWQMVTGRVRMRRRVTRLAIAATVLLGFALAFNALRIGDVEAPRVATIDRSHGAIYLLGEQSEMHAMNGLDAINAAQIVITEADSGIGLAWGNGGSLRIDEKSRVEFTSAESVYLHYGRVYFDSRAGHAVAAVTASGLRIDTDHGSVSNLGTQYMAFVDVERLRVSVREGEVLVDGKYAEAATASEGQQLTLSGSARPTIMSFSGYGEAWDWVETTAPAAEVDGKTVHEFLLWVGRETGLKVAYESQEAEQKARQGILRGNVEMEPRDELRFRMAGEDLDYRIQGGTIYVSIIAASRHP